MTPERSRQGVYDAHPAELVAALVGSDTIKLHGFGAEAMPPSWLRPGLRFVSVDGAPGAVEQEVRARTRHMAALRWVTLALLLGTMLATGLWVGAYTPMHDQPAIAGASWSIISVEDNGIILRAEGIVSLVRPGEQLPNGEQLQAVIPSRRAYVTDHSTVVIDQPPTPKEATP